MYYNTRHCQVNKRPRTHELLSVFLCLVQTTLSGLAFLDQLCKLKCLKLGVPEAYTEHWKSLDKVAIVLGRLQDLTIERKPNHAAAHDKQVSQILSLAPNTLKLDLSGCPNINESGKKYAPDDS